MSGDEVGGHRDEAVQHVWLLEGGDMQEGGQWAVQSGSRNHRTGVTSTTPGAGPDTTARLAIEAWAADVADVAADVSGVDDSPWIRVLVWTRPADVARVNAVLAENIENTGWGVDFPVVPNFVRVFLPYEVRRVRDAARNTIPDDPEVTDRDALEALLVRLGVTPDPGNYAKHTLPAPFPLYQATSVRLRSGLGPVEGDQGAGVAFHFDQDGRFEKVSMWGSRRAT